MEMQISRKLWQIPLSACSDFIALQKFYKYLTLGVLKSGIINISGPIAVLMLLEPEKKWKANIFQNQVASELRKKTIESASKTV